MSRWKGFGIALDELFNVLLLDGNPQETISVNAARRRNEGAGWACVLCGILGVLVERDHCDKALQPEPTSTSASVRAGGLLVIVGAILWASVHWGVSAFLGLF